MKYRGYIGTYSQRGSRGVYLVEADAQTGALTVLDAYPAENPSYLAIHGGLLFAALETAEGGAASYRIAGDGTLTELSRRGTGGSSPCHVSVSPDGRQVFLANYADGRLSVLPCDGGALGPARVIRHAGHSVNAERQAGPHAHCVQPMPDGKRLCAVDLGLDRALFYDMATMRVVGSFAVNAGSGPRHIVFSQKSPIAWLVCELSSEVYAFDRETGARVGVYSTLPAGFSGESACAAIKLSHDEQWLYATNRGHDSIACFRIRPGGSLTAPVIVACGGKTPRDVALSPDGRFLYAANQDSDSVACFRLEGGLPADTGELLRIPAAVCVVFA